MSSAVGFTFLLLISICHSFHLPAQCRPPPPSSAQPDDSITVTSPLPTSSPTTDPSNISTAPPTKSPTAPWDEACCEAIKNLYTYDPDSVYSICGSLHDSSIDSCILNQATLQIETINLRNCSLFGPMPSQFSAMPELKTLDLRDNTITGLIPPYFNNYKLFTKLQRFHIANNDFTGKSPSNLFQYEQLKYIDFQQNKRLIFNITDLNLTDSPALKDKPALAANFSFLNVILANDTDPTFYTFLEKLRFSQFSMRSSINNFSFIWRNRKDAKDFHTIYATETFDVFGNNITGEFPCFFKTAPANFYVADNGIQDTNITCYQSKKFEILMLFQRRIAYVNQSKCYSDFKGWAANNDHYKYCNFIDTDSSPLALKDCCANIPLPTKEPTKEPENKKRANTADWLVHNIEWFVLLLIFSFVVVIWVIWRNKKKKKRKLLDQGQEIARIPNKSDNKDTESLLCGDL